jgi:hypothetical protein
MAATTSVATIRSGHWIEFGAHEMSAACATVPASAEDPYLIYEI